MSEIEIPIVLRNEKYRFILLTPKNKIAFEEAWQLNEEEFEKQENGTWKNKKTGVIYKLKKRVEGEEKYIDYIGPLHNYKYNDEILLNHLKNGGNYGVVCGIGELRVRDIDDPKLAEYLIQRNKFETFTIKTGKGIHIYFEAPYSNENNVIILNNGEYRARNSYVVGPNSIHPNGEIYKVINNSEIKTFTEQEVHNKYIKDYLRLDTTNTIKEADLSEELEKKIKSNEIITKMLDGDLQGKASRSEAELSLVCRLIQIGLNKSQVFKLMTKCKLGKWQESPIQYRELTFEKALSIITKEKKDDFRNEAGLQVKVISNYDTTAQEISDLEIVADNKVEDMKIKQVEWLVKDLIPKYSLTLIGGKSASYKSTGTLHMAYCIAEGKKVFSVFDSIKSKVLYLNEENAWNVFKPLITKIRKGSIDELGSENIFFSTFQDLRLDTQMGVEKLKRVIEKEKIEVVVMDSLKRFIGFEENNADKVNEFYINVLKPLMVKYKISIILLHHTKKDVVGANKLDMLRGSSDFVNICDSIIFYKRKIGENKFEIEQIKNRAKFEAPKLNVRIVSDENKYEFICTTPAEKYDKEIELMDCERKVIDYLRKTPNIKIFTPAEIAKNVDDYGETRVKAAINELVTQTILLRVRHGEYEINKSHKVWVEQPVPPITDIL